MNVLNCFTLSWVPTSVLCWALQHLPIFTKVEKVKKIYRTYDAGRNTKNEDENVNVWCRKCRNKLFISFLHWASFHFKKLNTKTTCLKTWVWTGLLLPWPPPPPPPSYWDLFPVLHSWLNVHVESGWSRRGGGWGLGLTASWDLFKSGFKNYFLLKIKPSGLRLTSVFNQLWLSLKHLNLQINTLKWLSAGILDNQLHFE